MNNEYVYFSKLRKEERKKNKLNLEDINIGNLAIVYCNDINFQQFTDYYIVKIIEVNEKNKSVKIKMHDKRENRDLSRYIDLNVEPIKCCKNNEGIYSLPFDYLIDVKPKES